LRRHRRGTQATAARSSASRWIIRRTRAASRPAPSG